MYMIWNVVELVEPTTVLLTIVDETPGGAEPRIVKVRPEHLYNRSWLACKRQHVDAAWLETYTDFAPLVPIKVCECGADKSGAWGHYDWCPKFK